MKYLVIDEDDNNQMFVEEFDNLDEAIARADYGWRLLTNLEKKHTRNYYVLESINPDEEAENHYDGNPVKIYK